MYNSPSLSLLSSHSLFGVVIRDHHVITNFEVLRMPLRPQEEEEEYHERNLPFAKGGPIFVPELVGPLSSVPDFKASVLDELHCLQFELLDSYSDEDLSVDDLKVVTDEELFEQAFRESFEDSTETREDIGHCNLGMADNQTFNERENANSSESSCQTSDLTSDETLSNHPVKISTTQQSADKRENVNNSNQQSAKDRENVNNSNQQSAEERENVNNSNQSAEERENVNNSVVIYDCGSEEKIKRKNRKRGRHFDRDTRAPELEGSYLEKVKQLAGLKQKQDENKSPARLHSFCGNAKSFEGATSTSDNIQRMRSLRFMTTAPVNVNLKARRSEEHIPINYPEVIFCVEIYHNKNNSMKTQEFLVVGSRKLTELRDNIYCLTDKLMEMADKHDPSAYFLIESTFYNDTRDPSAVDYSKSALDWLENCKDEAAAKWEVILSGGALKKKQKELLGELDASSLPEFNSVNMQNARFSDLRFKLGAGYLYVHQGNCKHTIVIRDMRLIHPEDSQNQADYPLLTFQVRHRQRKCSVCKLYNATKMTVDDKWVPENPCYFCINCYFLLHYKEDNSLLYPHTVYDYYHEY